MAKLKASEKGIEVEIKKQLGQYISAEKLNRAFKKVGAEIIAITKKRTETGVDIFGRKFGSYTARYDKFKKKNFKTNYRKNIMMTGSLMNDLTYKVLDTKQTLTSVKGTIVVTALGGENRKKIEGLFSDTGYTKRGSYSKSQRMFLGLSVSGSNKTNEVNQITRILASALGIGKKTIGVDNAK